ncbi:MAG TPA: hypothetical protein VM260_04125, partial [Pirellula sp.]|nr:hypothetical protein [Pirellula sp.]
MDTKNTDDGDDGFQPIVLEQRRTPKPCTVWDRLMSELVTTHNRSKGPVVSKKQPIVEKKLDLVVAHYEESLSEWRSL